MIGNRNMVVISIDHYFQEVGNLAWLALGRGLKIFCIGRSLITDHRVVDHGLDGR